MSPLIISGIDYATETPCIPKEESVILGEGSWTKVPIAETSVAVKELGDSTLLDACKSAK